MCRGRMPSNITCMISCGKHLHKSKLGTSFNKLSRFTPYSTEKLAESSVFNMSQWLRCWCKFLSRSWAYCNCSDKICSGKYVLTNACKCVLHVLMSLMGIN